MSNGSDYHLERKKLLNDFFTQIITLSTGSIVLIATFLEKFAGRARSKGLAADALVLFVAALVTSLATRFTTTASVTSDKIESKYWAGASAFLAFVSMVLFLVAVGMLAFFGVHNLNAVTEGGSH
jgi:hypothetical protein